MATIQQLEQALIKADAAGNAEDARTLAAAIRQMRQQAQSVAPQQHVYKATTGMGTGERIAAGVGKMATDSSIGLQQAVIDSAWAVPRLARKLNQAAGSDVLEPLRKHVYDPIDAYSADLTRQADVKKRTDADLRSTAGGKVGEGVGYLTSLLGPGLLARGTALGSALLPSTIRGMALQGGFLGGVQPQASDDSRAMSVAAGVAGGAIGGVLAPVVGAVARPIARAAMAPFRPFTQRGQEQLAASVLRGSASDPARLMTAAPSAIPGVSRTLAEESLDPGIASLERTVRNRGAAGAEFDVVRRANNNARVQEIEKFAGNDAALAAAVQNRSSVTTPLRKAAMKDAGVDVGPVQQKLADLIKANATRPSVKDALVDFQKRSLEKADDSVQSLYGSRKYIDDLLSGKLSSEKGSARAAKEQLLQVKKVLDDQIKAVSPAFGDYLREFIAQSKPINRLQVGQTLLRDSSGSIVDPITHQYRVTPAAFGRQVQNLDKAARRATGFNKAKASDILEPDDYRSIRAIEDDLSRQDFADTAARNGSDTYQKAMNEGNILAAMDSIGVNIPGAGLLKMLGNKGRDQVNAALADVLANPAKARAILAKAPATHRRIIQEYLSAAGGRLGITAAAESE